MIDGLLAFDVGSLHGSDGHLSSSIIRIEGSAQICHKSILVQKGENVNVGIESVNKSNEIVFVSSCYNNLQQMVRKYCACLKVCTFTD